MDVDRYERVAVACAGELWDWLGVHHGRDEGVLLVTARKGHGPFPSRDEVLDALVAHGWTDGRRFGAKVTGDDARTMQLISPRRQGRWAESYRVRADRLAAEGRMHPAGAAAVAAAKAAGTWAVDCDVDALAVPDDLAAALGAARAWWDEAAPSYRRNVLRWIAGAKRAETRAKRVGVVADHARRGEKVPNY